MWGHEYQLSFAPDLMEFGFELVDKFTQSGGFGALRDALFNFLVLHRQSPDYYSAKYASVQTKASSLNAA